MASTTLADYQVLRDGTITLDASTSNRETTFNFTVPSDFAFEEGSRKPILAYKVRVYEDNTAFKVFVNFREVISVSDLDTSHTRGLWEAFSAKTAFPDGSSFSNPVPVRIVVSRGKIRFSDVVLSYQIRRNG